MDDILEEDDRTILDGVSLEPSRRKSHSYSHQLSTNTEIHHTRHQVRKHSLDDNDILSNNPSNNNTVYYNDSIITNSSYDDDFSPCSTDKYVDYLHLSQIIEGLAVGDGGTNDEFQQMPQQPLPEFTGSGGDVGIFKVPARAAVHPNRPPCLELRPHPLRETQVGKFLTTIASTETQLWAGLESSVRVWNYSDAYERAGGRARRGDDDAAPFYESANTSPTKCMMVDQGTKLVWSGHKDGKIRSWKMDQHFSKDTAFKEGLSWQAHRGPVLSMVISSYGDIWTGSEGGVLRVWSWEAIEKSLSLSQEERRMAALLVERSFIDLRSQVTVNGVCSISSSDVKSLLSDHVRTKVWAATSLSFSLWDARKKELVKVYNIDGQLQNRVDMSSSQDQVVEDEMNVKFVSKSKKEKFQGHVPENDINVKFVSKSKKEKSHGFLQRSRNAIIGAADAVRRVATKGAGAFAEETKKTESILLATDGMIWTGCSNGMLIQWDGNGTRLQDFIHHPRSVLCFCTYGSRIWVGYASGILQVLDIEGNLIAGWVAHYGPVVKLVVGNGYVYSMATHGGIRGWNISSPAPIDNIIRLELAEREQLYTRMKNVRILVGTWNVGQGRATHSALMSWLGSALSDVGIVVVGLQEVEMGAGFLAMSAAKETVGLEGSSVGQWWQDHIGKALDEGSTFERVGSRQLASLLIAIWVRKTLRTHAGDMDVAAVACGLGRAIGNKGGVSLRLRVFDRIISFTNCHFAAHMEAVNRRNADFNHIFRATIFSRSSNLLQHAAAGVSSAAQTLRGTNVATVNPEEGKPDLADADMVVFCGDFNYRLFGMSYDEARDLVSQRSFDWLREKDQLRAEMKAGRVFQGMREALIRFPPTYKFEKGKPGLGGYDSGEKKRIPAWCDRVLYRDNKANPTYGCSLACPVVASILLYEACMDVTESDHKPVRCKFNVDIAHVDRSVRRREFGRIVKSNETIQANLQALRFVPETAVSDTKIVVQNQEVFNLKITNRSGEETTFFQIVCEGQSTIKEDEVASDYRPRGSLGFPPWLEVTPAAGSIKPDQVVDISVNHVEFHKPDGNGEGIPQSWWSEDTRDKEVILLVNVRGSCSTDKKIHRIIVRHCFSRNNVEPNGHPSKRNRVISHNLSTF